MRLTGKWEYKNMNVYSGRTSVVIRTIDCYTCNIGEVIKQFDNPVMTESFKS